MAKAVAAIAAILAFVLVCWRQAGGPAPVAATGAHYRPLGGTDAPRCDLALADP